jgi:hypothetical protein
MGSAQRCAASRKSWRGTDRCRQRCPGPPTNRRCPRDKGLAWRWKSLRGSSIQGCTRRRTCWWWRPRLRSAPRRKGRYRWEMRCQRTRHSSQQRKGQSTRRFQGPLRSRTCSRGSSWGSPILRGSNCRAGKSLAWHSQSPPGSNSPYCKGAAATRRKRSPRGKSNPLCKGRCRCGRWRRGRSRSGPHRKARRKERRSCRLVLRRCQGGKA